MTTHSCRSIHSVLFVFWVLGCDSTTPSINPVDTVSLQDAGIDIEVVEDSSVEEGVGPVVREVMVRSPFGALDPLNLMHDGDFELSGRDALQYPWLGIEDSHYRTGVTCRSGLRCIEMPRDQYVGGMFVWPDAPAVQVSFYAKSESTECERDVLAVVGRISNWGFVAEAKVRADSDIAVDGWCRFSAVVPVPEHPGHQWWMVMLATVGTVVFDDVSMVAVDEEHLRVMTSEAKPLSFFEKQVVERGGQRLRRYLPSNPRRKPVAVENPTCRTR